MWTDVLLLSLSCSAWASGSTYPLSLSLSAQTWGTAAPSDLISVLPVPSRLGVFLGLILLHYQCDKVRGTLFC